MQRDLQQLAAKNYDVLVVGGGITGACIAHDAALRGLSVALLERKDFGGFTSAASSKLLHGGIRYLPKGQLWKVRESGREQIIFQQLAPHLTRWVPFLIPTVQGSLTKGALALKVAMKVYGLCHVGLGRLVDDPAGMSPKAWFMSAQEALTLAPQLECIEHLNGAQVLWESHMHSSERMTLAFLKTAVENGADLANYVQAERYVEEQGRVTGVQARDELAGQEFIVTARLVINSSGPAAQALNSSVAGLRLKKKLTGFSRGVHLVTRQIHEQYALALTTRKKTEGFITRGGRHFFIIPWRGRSLIGTTNVPFEGDFDDMRVTSKDIDDFLVDINEALPDVHLTRRDVFYAFTGLYPLIVKDVRSDTYQGTGEYQLVDHLEADGIDGVMTALGAKFTTARNVAEKTVDMAVAKLQQECAPCRTVSTPLIEGRMRDVARFVAEKKEQYKNLLSPDMVTHLIRYHGTEIDRIMELATASPKQLEPLPAPGTLLGVEILYAVREEMALHMDDVLFRRTGGGTIGRPDAACLDRVAAIMAEELGWDAEQKQRETNRVLSRYRYNQSETV